MHALRYTSPARRWVEALPVGNGLRAAMSAGLDGGDRLWLNDVRAWSGPPSPHASDPTDHVAAAGPEHLGRIRAAIERGDVRDAELLLQQMQTPWVQAYLPLATLDLRTVRTGAPAPATRVPAGDGTGTALARGLSLRDAVAWHEHGAPGHRVRHETWADADGGPVVHHVTGEDAFGLDVHLTSLLRPDTSGTPRDLPPGVHLLVLVPPADVAPGHEHPPEPVRYDPESVARIVVAVRAVGEPVSREHLLLIGTAVTHDPAAGAVVTVDEAVARALALVADRPAAERSPGTTITADTRRRRRTHVAAHRALYDRCALDLPSPVGASELPTDRRVDAAVHQDDPGLTALCFHYGRYLLLASSRSGGLPATLQGIWNAELPGPWSSAYTLNINTQMAYWPAETTDLAECHEPLLAFVERLASGPGAHAAEHLYGARGWAAHHNSDAWAHAGPVGGGRGDPAWASWSLGGVWLASHLWEHHLFASGVDADPDYLRERAWPALRGAGLFALDWVRSDGVHAWTSPSTSPENHVLSPDGRPTGVGVSATMDVELLTWLAHACRQATAELGEHAGDTDWLDRLEAAVRMLPTPRVGRRGELIEWADDLPEAEPEHRHVSHLVGVFPLGTATGRTPTLRAAARRTLELRGPESTGWSLTWRAAIRARLADGEGAHTELRKALRPALDDAGEHRGGLYPNLFSAHPPFQVDGNLGLTAAVAEMLVHSHGPVLHLLPALPSAWPEGAVRGLRARSAHDTHGTRDRGLGVDIIWSQGRLTRATLHNDSAAPVTRTVGIGRGALRDVLVPAHGEFTLAPHDA